MSTAAGSASRFGLANCCPRGVLEKLLLDVSYFTAKIPKRRQTDARLQCPHVALKIPGNC